MNGSEKISQHAVEDFVFGKIPAGRFLRLLRYVACLIIVCDGFGLRLDMSETTLVDMLDRTCFIKSIYIIVPIWCLYSFLCLRIFSIGSGNLSYYLNIADVVVDFLFTLYFLAYSFLFALCVYNHTVDVGVIGNVKLVAIIYIVICAAYKCFLIRRDEWDDMMIKLGSTNTGYADIKGVIIKYYEPNYNNCYVQRYNFVPKFIVTYYGKVYYISKNVDSGNSKDKNGIYILKELQDHSIVSSDESVIFLKYAAKDFDGHLTALGFNAQFK